MTPAPPTLPIDPRHGNSARECLIDLVHELVPPANYRVVLEVDRQTEKLILKVLKRKAFVIKAFGHVIWRHVQSWSAPEVEQRRIEGRTYESVIDQLQAHPEFLEFEFVVEGDLAYHTAASF